MRLLLALRNMERVVVICAQKSGCGGPFVAAVFFLISRFSSDKGRMRNTGKFFWKNI